MAIRQMHEAAWTAHAAMLVRKHGLAAAVAMTDEAIERNAAGTFSHAFHVFIRRELAKGAA